MPICPKCLHEFHPGAELACPHCGLSLQTLDKKYGNKNIPFSRVTDETGVLRLREQEKLNAFLAKLERKIPPVRLAVYFPDIQVPQQRAEQMFWAFNHFVIERPSFTKDKQAIIEPEWLFVFGLDVRSDAVWFMWGYALDPYVNLHDMNRMLNKSLLTLREADAQQAVIGIMRKAVRLLRQQVRLVLKNPDKHGIDMVITTPHTENKNVMPRQPETEAES